MKKLLPLFFFLSFSAYSQTKVILPEVILSDISTEIIIDNKSSNQPTTYTINNDVEGKVSAFSSDTLSYVFKEKSVITLTTIDEQVSESINPIPLWLSLLPPVIAIFLALLFREVVTSLLLGIFSGALIIQFYDTSFFSALLKAAMRTIDTYILNSLNDGGHLSIIVFSMLIGGMVSVISKNGGMQGVVNRISNFATTPKSGQLATWFLGIAIFFDDYANTLIVGNTMRPVTDRLKISREKLAYLVDSTAAPIAAIAFVTTWIGAELGYIESGIAKIEGLDEGVYSTFISSLAYSFYPILALAFMLILILKGRDFGPMHAAERKARLSLTVQDETNTENNLTKEFEAVGQNHNSLNAIIPVLVVILGTVAGLLYTGWDSDIWNSNELNLGRKLSAIIGGADSYQALLWSSLAGLITAIKLSVLQKILSLNDSIEAAIHGFKTMLPAIIILSLAWALALVIEELHTADLLTSIMSDSISPYLIPTVTFLLAALVAFSTGSSWGTMAILYPLMLPATWEICTSAGFDYDLSLGIFHNVVACVLAGSVLGDHCSPISDTTILSSLASSCNHIDHVRTQMPYALTVGAVAILFGTIPSAFGIPFWVTITFSIGVLITVVHFIGKPTETD